MMEPYTNHQDTRGASLISENRLMDFMLELHREKIDLHIHCWGDRAAHEALNAYERAKQKIGVTFYPRLTLSHLPVLKDEDFRRFKELGVVANFTPGWNGDVSMEFFEPHLGNRSKMLFRARPLLDDKVPVTFSSDIISPLWINWANPYYSMQVAHNRQAVQGDKNAPVLPPVSERLSLEELIRGYTLSGAYQLRMDDRIGSIQTGKEADLVVLNENLFKMDRYDIHNATVAMTLKAGQTVYTRDWIAVLKEKMFKMYQAYFIWSNS
jgi:predicted amidohydrolase YtcJ